jgi:hypothetical protein
MKTVLSVLAICGPTWVIAIFLWMWADNYYDDPAEGRWRAFTAAWKRLASAPYKVPRNEWRRWRSERAHRYRLKHDYWYRMSEAVQEVESRRYIHVLTGGHPLDPDFPTLFKVLAEWGYWPFKRQPWWQRLRTWVA